MLITKQQFITIINLIKQIVEKDKLINKFVKDISEAGYSSGAYLSEILILEEMLQSALEPYLVNSSESLIDYFIFDLDFGQKPILQTIDFSDYIIDSKTNLSTAENLYDFLLKKHQIIEGECN